MLDGLILFTTLPWRPSIYWEQQVVKKYIINNNLSLRGSLQCFGCCCFLLSTTKTAINQLGKNQADPLIYGLTDCVLHLSPKQHEKTLPVSYSTDF